MLAKIHVATSFEDLFGIMINIIYFILTTCIHYVFCIFSQYYRNEMERLATLNKQLEVHRSQLQEEIAAVQKSLYHVKVDLIVLFI